MRRSDYFVNIPLFHARSVALSPVRLKICGITRPEDGSLAAELGADALGLVFYPQSPRYVTESRAREVVAVLPPFVNVVGLFMNAEPGFVNRVLSAVPLDMLQFHGDETPEYCESFGRRYIKAVPMMDNTNVAAYTERFATAAGFLLDAVRQGEAGGTGRRFDWSRIPEGLAKPVILAGGLEPANIGEALRLNRCYAIDVSSGVESAKGIKDPEKMRALIEAIKKAQ